MRINIKTAGQNAEIAVLKMLRSELDQIVLLIYSGGLYILQEYVGAHIISPLFPIEEPILSNILKLNVGESTTIMNVKVECLSEEDMIKSFNLPEYSIYYRKNGQYFDLIKFNSEALEASHNMFFQNFNPTNLVMQPVDINDYFDLDTILERIKKVGMKNLTKFEKIYLQQVSNE